MTARPSFPPGASYTETRDGNYSIRATITAPSEAECRAARDWYEDRWLGYSCSLGSPYHMPDGKWVCTGTRADAC